MAARKTGASRSGARKGATTAPQANAPAWLDVAADYYWEQDAEHRFTVWRSTDRKRAGVVEAATLLGKTSAELCAAPGDDTDHWVRHRAVLEARGPFRDVAHALPLRSGAVGNLSLSGAAAYDAEGAFVGYRGVARDTGGYARLTRLLAL
ncbi:MAG TPA: hypothetical protein VM692_17400, partial [Gammaproteobacteria bacterium]|nr:hypothetical protein [Gammaproteobacteria bacterium]